MREIGSEFSCTFSQPVSTQFPLDWLPLKNGHGFVFSGRTAIETVLRDIGPTVRTALLPSYCCASMIEPFIKAGLQVSFYDVDFIDGVFSVTLPSLGNNDLFLRCNYFGFWHNFPEAELSHFQQAGGIVIEDITHSLLSDKQFHPASDYLVASLRKWGPLLCGGFYCKRTGGFAYVAQSKPPEEFLSRKRSAMSKKEEYLSQPNAATKEVFLQEFSKSNAWLASHYSNLGIDQTSLALLQTWNVAEIRQKRKENADFLYASLSGQQNFSFLFPRADMDCPLYVPICVAKDLRSKLQQALTAYGIYCPIHWPLPQNNCVSSLYETELSLICDQRYNITDMEQIALILQRM